MSAQLMLGLLPIGVSMYWTGVILDDRDFYLSYPASQPATIFI